MDYREARIPENEVLPVGPSSWAGKVATGSAKHGAKLARTMSREKRPCRHSQLP